VHNFSKTLSAIPKLTGATTATSSKFHTDEPQMLGTAERNLFASDT